MYRGKLVFLESLAETKRYANGEYLCVFESPSILYCIVPDPKYTVHYIMQFPILGNCRYEVISYSEISYNFLMKLIKGITKSIDNSQKKRKFTSSMYDSELTVLRMLYRLETDNIICKISKSNK